MSTLVVPVHSDPSRRRRLFLLALVAVLFVAAVKACPGTWPLPLDNPTDVGSDA